MVDGGPAPTPEPRWRRSALAALSGALLGAAFPPLDLGYLAWLAPVPLLFALQGVSPARGARLGWMAGFVALLSIGRFTSSFGGDNPVLRFLPLLLFAAIEALFYALLGALVSAVLSRGRPWRVLAGVPAAWLLCEWLRGWGPLGFPFGDIGYAMHGNTHLLQLAALGGHRLVGLLVAMGGAALFVMLREADRRPALAAVAAILFAHLVGVGLRSDAASIYRPSSGAVRVTALQGGAAKNGDRGLEFAEFRDLLWRTSSTERSRFSPGLTVWYESAPYGDLLRNTSLQDDVATAVSATGQPLLTGTRSVDDEGEPGNYAALLSPDGRVVATYRKRRPVPFGEWVPFRRFLPLVSAYGMPPRDDRAGNEWTVLLDAPLALGVPICFESAYPEVSRAFVLRGANLLCVITNDSWFGRTGMMEQHRNVAVFRAVETRRWLVRCGRTGYTGFVAPWGSWSATLPVDRPGTTTCRVTLDTALTPYVRWGDWPLVLALLALAASLSRPLPLATTLR